MDRVSIVEPDKIGGILSPMSIFQRVKMSITSVTNR